MQKAFLWVLAIVVIAGAGWFWYAHRGGTDEHAAVQDLGMYPYTCDNGSTFIFSPLEGMEHVQVSADAQGMFTGTATLAQTGGTSYAGTAPDGQQVALTGDGETIRLTVGSATAACTPKPDSENAPWNWGDVSTASGSFTGSMKDLSARGGDWKCTIASQASSDGQPVSGTIYVSGPRLRADMSTTAPGAGAVDSHLIVDGTDAYTWSSLMPQGIKTTTASADEGSEEGLSGTDARYTYQCEPARADAALFAPPAGITFRTL
jgi:hypothetical protein